MSLSWLDKILNLFKGEELKEPDIEPKEIEEKDISDYIDLRAMDILVEALDIEKEKIITDAFVIAKKDNRKKIEYRDMIESLRQNGFSVELTDTD